MHSKEDDCILDAILEEQANEKQVQDLLTPELFACPEVQQELRGMSLVQGFWREK